MPATVRPSLPLPAPRRALPPAGVVLRALTRWLRARARPDEGDGVHRLARDATRAFHPRRAGLALLCQGGLFLVTQAGDLDDHLLAPGDTFRTRARGKVVAWALESGALRAGRADENPRQARSG